MSNNILDTKDLPQMAGFDSRLDAVTDAEATLRSVVDTEVKRGDKAWHDEIYAAYEEWSVEQ